jgi:DNA-directed RNA polymerase specialized sigma24 family protein
MAQTLDEQVLEKLDQILRILVLNATRDVKQRQQIDLLDKAGFAPKTIADLLGTNANLVRVELVAVRKSRSKKAGTKKK